MLWKDGIFGVKHGIIFGIYVKFRGVVFIFMIRDTEILNLQAFHC